MPWWAVVLGVAGAVGSLTLLCLAIWGIIELVPAIVRWLDRNQA